MSDISDMQSEIRQRIELEECAWPDCERVSEEVLCREHRVELATLLFESQAPMQYVWWWLQREIEVWE